MDAILVLEDGRWFRGRSFGAPGERVGEVVFNTGMTGYQEILSDPSYCGQLVVMTAPHIGNTGVNDFDAESVRPQVAGFIVRAYSSECYSSWRSRGSLSQLLADHHIVAITDVDTRAITRHIRSAGAMRGIISTESDAIADLREKARRSPRMEGRDLTGLVTCTTAYEWASGSEPWEVHNSSGRAPFQRVLSPTVAGTTFHVVAYDFGLKRTILRRLIDVGCRVTVVPAQTAATDALALRPDGIFYSNGPGDPSAATYAVRTLRTLIQHRPVFGICLGHQLMGLAVGGKTYKLPFGHHGINHPVRRLKTGAVEVTSQNHGFAVDADTLPADVEVTHISLNDHTVEGLRHRSLPAFSVQYHPEAGPGPHDATYLFQEFVLLMQETRGMP